MNNAINMRDFDVKYMGLRYHCVWILNYYSKKYYHEDLSYESKEKMSIAVIDEDGKFDGIGVGSDGGDLIGE